MIKISNRVLGIEKSAIHEMTRLSKEVKDVAFLSWAKPTSDTPEHIKEAAVSAIRSGLAGGYSENSGLLELREEIVRKLKRDNNMDARVSQILVTVGAIEGLAAALKGSQDCVAEFKRHYLSARDLMCSRLDRLGSAFEYQKPGGSYLMFPKILLKEGNDSTAFCKKLLREARVSTTPGIAFGPTGEGHLRMSFCVSEDEINRAFDRIENYPGVPNN